MNIDFYFDTSIWLEIYEKRNKNSEIALNLLLKIIDQNLKIYYSDLHIKELKNLGYNHDQINSILNVVKYNNLRHVHIYKKQLGDAKKMAKERDIPRKDVLHAILCKDNGLQLITRDYHFEKLKDITITKKPEDFI